MVYKKLRIKYSRTGRLRLISHLDICRTIRTAFRRAKIEVRYSEGYNPHPRMNFLLPLPLGAESNCEYLDIFVPESDEPADVCARLDAATAPELHFIYAYEPDSQLYDTAYSDYEMILYKADLAGVNVIIENPPHIQKKTKSGAVNDVDIRPLIRSARAEQAGENVIVYATLECREKSYLNPDTYASLFECEDHLIRRTALYFADGREFC